MKYGIKNNISIPGDITKKSDLFRVIRELTNSGFFFEIRNYYNGKGHSCYMVNVLGHKSE